MLVYVCARARAHTNLGKKDLRAAAGIDKRICKQQHAHTNTKEGERREEGRGGGVKFFTDLDKFLIDVGGIGSEY